MGQNIVSFYYWNNENKLNSYVSLSHFLPLFATLWVWWGFAVECFNSNFVWTNYGLAFSISSTWIYFAIYDHKQTSQVSFCQWIIPSKSSKKALEIFWNNCSTYSEQSASHVCWQTVVFHCWQCITWRPYWVDPHVISKMKTHWCFALKITRHKNIQRWNEKNICIILKPHWNWSWTSKVDSKECEHGLKYIQ